MKLVLALLLVIIPKLALALADDGGTAVGYIDYSRFCVKEPLTEDAIECWVGWAGLPCAACVLNVEITNRQEGYTWKVYRKRDVCGEWGVGIFNFLIVPAAIDIVHQQVLRQEMRELTLQEMKQVNRHICPTK